MITSNFLDQQLCRNYTWDGVEQPATGGSIQTDAAVGGCLQAAGGVSYVPGAPAFVVACWFSLNANANNAGLYPLLSVWDSTTPLRAWALAISGLQVSLRISVDGTNVFSMGDAVHPNLALDVWHLAIMQWQPSGVVQVWTDGVPGTGGSSAPASIFNAGVPIRIMGQQSATGLVLMDGAVAGAGIWNVVFDDTKAAALWNGGHLIDPSRSIGIIGTAPVHYWRLAEVPPGPWHDTGTGLLQMVPQGNVDIGPTPP